MHDSCMTRHAYDIAASIRQPDQPRQLYISL